MLTDEQMFKFSFLAHLADQGIGPVEAHHVVKQLLDVVEKRAEFDLTGVLGTVGGAISGGAKALAEKSIPLAIGANFLIPGLAGAAGGYALSKMQDVDDEDASELRTRESIQNYRRLADEMAVRRRLRDNRAGHQQAMRPLVR